MIQEFWKYQRYQSFDIKRILLNMKITCGPYMRDVETLSREIKIKTASGDKAFKYSNKESMARYIFFFCFLFANRGSIWDKVIQKSIPQIKDILEWLKVKYVIDTNVRDSNNLLDPDLVTIQRIAACFPLCIFVHPFPMCEHVERIYTLQ